MDGLIELLNEADSLLDRLSSAELMLQLSIHNRSVSLEKIDITRERLMYLIREGYTVVNIAAKFRVSRQTIHTKINLYSSTQEVFLVHNLNCYNQMKKLISHI